MSISCRACRSLRINQSISRQCVQRFSSQSTSQSNQSVNQSTDNAPVGRVVPIIKIYADAESFNQSNSQSQTKHTTTLSSSQSVSQSNQKRHFSTHALGNQSIDRSSKHDTNSIHHAIHDHPVSPLSQSNDQSVSQSNSQSINQSNYQPDGHSVHQSNQSTDQSVNQPTLPDLEFMSPVPLATYDPDNPSNRPKPDRKITMSIFEMHRSLLEPFARSVARLFRPYTETLGYMPVITGRRIYYGVKGYILAAPKIEKLVWKQVIDTSINPKDKKDQSINQSTEQSINQSTNQIPQLIYDNYTAEHPFAWLFMFVINHRIITAIHASNQPIEQSVNESDDQSINQSINQTKKNPLGADIPRVHQVFLEFWWHDLSLKLADTVGGLMLNKNLMQRQKRFISAFHCFEIAINQSIDLNELKFWFHSILARELYGWQKTSMEGPPAKLIDQLSDWLIDSLECMDEATADQVAAGRFKFPVMPIMDLTAHEHRIILAPFRVEDGRLVQVSEEKMKEEM